jgi:hypothetical protein
MRILANLNVVGTLDLDSVANAGVDTDRFLVQDSNGVVRYRTGAEVASDIGASNLAASVLKHQVKLGEAIAKGQAVYVSSSDGTNMIVSKASNASEATSSKTLGLLETGGALNAQVNVITEGLLAGLDTSTAVAGDPVWLGTNGNLIFGLNNKPYAPAHLVFVGIVTRVQQNNGEIFIKPQNGFELREIHDVQITTTPNNNEVLSYETSSSLYKMKSIPTLLGYTPADSARILTINGTAYDLSANRTWNVGTVTSVGLSVPTGFAIGSSPVTGSGTLALSFAAGYSLPTTASQSNWDTAYSNRITSLTTTGTSGAATLSSNVLNIPNYTLAGLGGVSGSGTTNTLPKFSSSTGLTDSIIREVSGSRLLIGTGTVDDTTSIIQTNGEIRAVHLTLSGAVSSNTNLWIKSVTGFLGQIIYMNNSNMTFALRDNATYWDVYSYVTGSAGQKLIVYANGTVKLPGYTSNGFLKTSASDGTLVVDTNTYLTGNQSITLSGDATGSGTTSIAVTLSNSGVTAGTYRSVTVDSKGRVTAGTNPTTISGYGITDAYTKTEINNFFSGTTAITGYNKSNWDTAFGWGNHASQGYATTSYVTTQINNLVAGAPGLLDTLDELAAALGDDPNFATTVTTALSNRLRVDTATQGLTSTQQSNGRTNLGLGSLATLSSIGNSYITDLAWSKITGAPSFLTAEADTLASVTGRGATTSSAVTFNAGITVNGTAHSIFNKPSTSAYQTVSLFGTSGGGVFITSDNAIVGRGAYYNSGWIATATSGAALDFTAISGGVGIFYFTGATVGGAPTMSATYTLYHTGNLTNLNQLTNGPGYITGNQNITLSGDVTGSGATSIVTTIANNAITTAKINNGAVTAAKLATFGAGEGLSWAANTDGASIIFESTGDGASGGRALSNLLIALTDNGDEGLKVTSAGAELFYVNTNQLQYKGNNIWTAANLTNLNQLTNGPGYITSSGSITGSAGSLSDDSGYIRTRGGGTEANIDTYTDNGVRSIAFTGYSQHLLSWNVGGSPGTIQQMFHYNTPANGWRIRNKTDNNTWSSWGYVVMTSANQGLISGTIATQSWVQSQGYASGGPFIPVSANTNATGWVSFSASTQGTPIIKAIQQDTASGYYLFQGIRGSTEVYRVDRDGGAYFGGTVTSNGFTIAAADVDVRVNRGRFQVWNNAGTGNLGYRIRTDENGGWRWQFVDGSNSEYFGVAYSSGNTSILGSLTIGGNTALHAANYNSYAPTLTGGGASGTWGISITGSSASATNATNLYGAGGSYIQSTSTGTSYTANYQVRENSGGGGNTNEVYAPQLAFHWSGVVASSIMMESSGRIAIRNNPGSGYESFIAYDVYGSNSMRAPQFRFTNSSNNAYLTGNSDWGFRVVNDNGYIQFGPANGSWAHIYSDKSFYFNQEIYVNNNQVIHPGNTSGVLGAKYQISDTWLRVNSDNRQFQMYGNSRTMIYRTDGNTNEHGGGGYAHIFYYGGSADGNRRMIINTDGTIWSSNYGWLSDAFASKSTTHVINAQYNATISTDGWYTIASYGSGRALATFHIFDTDSSRHNYAEVKVNWSYGHGGVTVVNNGRHGVSTIKHVRLLYNTSDQTYGGVKIQVYCENSTFVLRIRQEYPNDISGWGSFSQVSPTLENSPAGWAEYTRAHNVNERGVITTSNSTGYLGGNVIWHQGNLTNLNQLTNGPGYITGYTETDTLATVTNRGNVSAGDIYVPSTTFFRARYNSTDAYHGSFNWYGLQLGNNGDNFIIGGRTATGGNLTFYVNNTSNFTTINGVFAAKMHSTGRTSFGQNSDNGYQVQVYGSLYSSDWIRVGGSQGLYFESYGGGWNMSDSTWIRTYNNKSIYAGTGVIRTDAGDTGLANYGTANWYLLDFDSRGASSGKYGVGLTSDVNNRTLSFHVPNHAAYSSSGNVPKFGWYSNGAVELMTLQSATGNLWTKGSISIAGNTALHAGNYNSYAPTLTGGGASGTWGINITGNAGYASSAGNADTVDGYHMNQNVLTSSSPTFSGMTSNGEINSNGFRFQNGYAATYCGFGGGSLYNGYHIESSWGNLRHGDLSNYEVSADGSSWSAGNIDANIYNLFLGERDKGGSLTIAASGVGRYQRFTFAIGYKNFDMLHITGSTNGEQIYIKLETSTDSGSSYSENFTNTWSSWPGNFTKFWSIFNSNINRIRLTIYKPGNNYSNSASINSINYYGGYGGYSERYHMQVYTYDYQNASITRSTTISGNLTTNGSNYIAGGSNGLYLSGGNNRIYFSGYRALEGSTTGSNLQVGEGYGQTQIQSANTQIDGTLTMGTSGTQYIRMGRFPASVTNTGEAWIGRASDRNAGTMTVQLGGSSASGRQFEVVDYAWSVVLFNVSSAGNVTASADMRAPIYYDSQNTAYYLDPNSTTSIRTVGSWRADSANWDGEFAGKIQYHSNSWYLQANSYWYFRNAGGANVTQIDSNGNISTNGSITVGSGLNSSDIFMNDGDEGTRRIHCNSNRIGFLTQSANWGAYCDDDGNWTAVGDITAYSDARVKENVKTVENALDKTLKMRGVTFTRNDIEDKSTKIGVIAQEVMEVLPEVVKKADDGMYNVSYGNIVGVLIEAIKEQQKQIDDLKSQINGTSK